MKRIKIDVESEEYIPQAVEEAMDSIVDKIYDTFNTPKFVRYIEQILKRALKSIADEQVNTILSDALSDTDKVNYLSSMDTEIHENTIYLFNNSVIDDIPSRVHDPDKLAKYPLQLSLAKIVEYGIGYTGALNTPSLGRNDNWQYDVNEHGYTGWYYVDSNGIRHWTNGFAGRLIFLRLVWWIERNIREEIFNYLKKNM